MAVTIEEVNKLAALSRVEMSADEKEAVRKDLESILGYVSELQSVDVSGVPPYLGDKVNVFREDDDFNVAGEYAEKILADAPRTEKGYVLVKQILGEKGESR